MTTIYFHSLPAASTFRKLLAPGARMALAAQLLSVTGCTVDLETGYKYRPLTATPTERRAYYASPFTPEKNAAQQEQLKHSSGFGL